MNTFDNQASTAKRAPTPEEMTKLLRQWADELDFPGTKSSNARAALLRAAADALAERERLPEMLCKSGRFETGQGTCAAICMDQLGDPRKRGCSHIREVFAWALPSPPPAKEGEKT